MPQADGSFGPRTRPVRAAVGQAFEHLPYRPAIGRSSVGVKDAQDRAYEPFPSKHSVNRNVRASDFLLR